MLSVNLPFITSELIAAILVLLLFFVFISCISGWSVGKNWKSPYLIFIYVPLLAAAQCFLSFALFGATLFNLSAFIFYCALLSTCMALSFRIGRTTQMQRQYPWECKRVYLFWIKKTKV